MNHSDDEKNRLSISSTSYLLKSRLNLRSPTKGQENCMNNFNIANGCLKKFPANNKKLRKQDNPMKIYLRVRPLKPTEKNSCVDVEKNQIIIHPPPHSKGQVKAYDFKRIFNETSTQEEVFRGTFLELLPSLTEGRDLLLFAYGVTGAGKTFTIEGTKNDPGLLSRSLKAILNSMKPGGPADLTKFSELLVSVFEIFNEKLYDLLIANPSSQTKVKKRLESKSSLSLCRSADGRTIVEGANEWIISSESQIDDLIAKANLERHKAETTFNHNSSRSHVIFRLTLNRKNGSPVYASIVDLAGCERTKTMGDVRVRESCNINKSMLVLGRCIRNIALKQTAVPYRESLITRLFKDFFESPGKSAVAAVIVNVTKSAEQYDDTNFSLSFAVDASECHTSVISYDNHSTYDIDDVPHIMPSVEPIDTHPTTVSLDNITYIHKYLSHVEDFYQQQVSELMERNRCTNRLFAVLSDSVPRSKYDELQRENEQLRARLTCALKKIDDLTQGRSIVV